MQGGKTRIGGEAGKKKPEMSLGDTIWILFVGTLFNLIFLIAGFILSSFVVHNAKKREFEFIKKITDIVNRVNDIEGLVKKEIFELTAELKKIFKERVNEL